MIKKLLCCLFVFLFTAIIVFCQTVFAAHDHNSLPPNGIYLVAGRIGDANDDGKVNVNDVTDVQKYVRGLISDIKRVQSDINHDGSITDDDAYEISKYLSYFPNTYYVNFYLYVPYGLHPPSTAWRLGDVNGDGQITNADVTLLSNISALTSEQVKRADANMDNELNSGDVSLITDYANGNCGVNGIGQGVGLLHDGFWIYP